MLLRNQEAVMGDMEDSLKAKGDEIENKAHEMKGRAEQKKKDMEADNED